MSGFARGRLVWLILLAGCLLQQPGLTTWDTKLDLTVDPGAFLARALHLWNPDASFGELQNQAYGYLFPQGPFFVLGELAGVPDWVVQRLWSALLLIVAYEGTRYVARAMGMTAGAGVLAGLAYTLSPRLLGAVGVLTGEVVPTAVLPWALLPLVLAGRGRLGPRQAGLWCGVAVFCMSGVNAAEVAAVVPLLAFVVLAQLREAHGRPLAVWWVVGMIASCAWWLVPLLLLGRYSPPFLDFIETSDATTFSTGWSNSVRGSEHWLSYVTLGDQAWWPAAHQMATLPVLVLTTGLVAALGLLGLCQRSMPLRGPLLASLVLGLLCLTAGNPSVVGSLIDGPVRDLLDGALAPLRNVHKVDPLIRLPLALGVGHAAALLLRLIRPPDLRHWSALVVVVVVVAGGLPLATDSMRMPGYREIPAAWYEAASYLERQPGSRVLVLPGTGFGLQDWGWTIDEPMQGVATSSWVSRSQVPLVPGPTARYLDTIERRIASGEGGVGLADMLARGGITHVLLRRDLNPFVTETVPTARAEVALANTPGLGPVAAFGRTGFGDQALIDVYAVEGAVSRVSLVDADAVATLAGAPDDLVTALETGSLGRETPVVITARPGTERVVGDGYRRVERQFGRVHEAVSQTRSRLDPWTTNRRAHDFPGVPRVPLATSEVLDETGQRLRVEASSSQGYPDELGPVRPEYGPQSAVDGNGATDWRSGSFEAPTDQWIDLRPEGRLSGGVLGVQFEFGAAARVTRVRVRAWSEDGEAAAVYGVPASGLLLAPLPVGEISRIRIEIVGATGGSSFDQVRVSEISLQGHPMTRSLVLPEPVGADDTVVLRLDPPRRACVDVGLGPQCQEVQARPGEDAGRLDRTFETLGAGAWNLTGTVVAGGVASAALLAPTTSSLRVRALSVLGGDPAVAGAFALDDNPGTVWLTENNAEQATLQLTWHGKRLISGLSIVKAQGDVVAPATARLRSGNITRLVDLDWSPKVRPFIANGRLRITFTRPTTVGSHGRPMGVGEVDIDGLGPLERALDLSSPTGAVCGLGPEVRVDGSVHPTEVVGTLDDVRLGRPLAWRVCDGPVELMSGRHRVEVAPTAQFQAVELSWTPADRSRVADDGSSDRTLTLRRWGDTSRQVDVGPGDAAILRVAENVNDGWRATLGETRLRPVTLDGWQQGYLVPAGDGGRVVLTYTPDAPYRAGLLGGLVLAGLLLMGAALGQLLALRRPIPVPPTRPSAAPVPAGWVGWRRIGQLAAAIGVLVLGGPVVAVSFLCTAWQAARRYALALGAVALSAAAVAAAFATETSHGRPGVVADGLTAAGVGLMLGAVVFESPDRFRERATSRVGWRSAGRSFSEHWTLLLGLLLVLGQAAMRATVASGSFFWQDDFLHLYLSRTLGLSRDYLVRDYSGHLEPAQYVVVWIVGQLGQGSFMPAVVALVSLQALASVLLLVLLRLLFGTSPWILVPFAAYLFTPLGLATATWFAAGLQAFPLQIGMLVSLIGLVRLDQSGRRRWWVLSVAGQALGLVFWEKGVLILPTLLAVDVLVLASGLPFRQRWRRLRARAFFWLTQATLLAAYIGFYLAVTAADQLGAERDRGVWPTLHDVLLKTLLPGLFGGPWHADGALNTVFADSDGWQQMLFVGLTVLTVVASVWRRGRAAWGGWTLIAGYLAMDVALLLLGRGEYLLLVARDPRYITDALPIVAIGVCAAFTGPRRARGDAPPPPAHARGCRAGPAVIAMVAVGVVTVSGLVTTWRMTPLVQHSASEQYVETLTKELDAAPAKPVLDTPVPTYVSVAVDLDGLLHAVWREQALDRPGAHPQFVSERGALVPADMTSTDVEFSGPQRDCGWTLGPQPRELVSLSDVDGARLVRLRYLAPRRGVLHLAVGEAEQATSYHRGLGERYFVVTGQSGEVRAWVTQGVNGLDAGMCLTDLVRGTPTPRA